MGVGSVTTERIVAATTSSAVRLLMPAAFSGFDASKIETLGSGKTNQVKSCPDKTGGKADRKALIECLAPNRRVVVELKGMPR